MSTLDESDVFDAPVAMTPIALRRRPNFAALATLFRLTLRQHIRGRRLLVLACIFLLPAGIAILARSVSPPSEPAPLLSNLVFTLIPHALVPLTALLYAAGMIRDEVEDQTLTYLLIRPLPRWAIYLIKLLATWLVTALLAGLFTILTYAAIYWGDPDLWAVILPGRALRTAALLALSLAAYCSLLGFLSLLVRRALVAGVAYIVAFEWLLANIDFAVRRLTVVYYFRVLSERWLDMRPTEWSIDLTRAPSALECVLTLLGASLAAAILGARMFSRLEFRVKTPEGS